MADRFEGTATGLDSPGRKIAQVTSGVDLAAGPCRALLVGTAGTATVVDIEGNTSTNIPLQQGYNPIRVTKVTFGTAADIWAIY
ncbi:hypothetical protein IVB12_15265 [Bradyrhizobium sp. 179]|uniref:spike base protein, RCAP_Rcc01079 family n=1 Tax=Bradyrhizobium sp. 179 TaxID=2782648 RepID=UPI001FF71F75|nr:hypothetical protein [Bradyrhizobium sp. 179]MCK1543274.1 hypothetical protein [Bradyrhizobium sp. 179]